MRIETPGDLTAEWLTETLKSAPVTAFETERIGTGQMSECYRVTLQYDPDGSAGSGAGPASVVLKVAAADPTSRQTGLAMGLYEKEVRFYTDIAPRLSGPIATCHHTGFDPATGIFDLVLDDAAPARQGDEIRGASIEQAIHSPVTIADVETMGMSRGERAITFALATWMAHLDGVVTDSENATLLLLRDRLGIPTGIRQRAADAAMHVAQQSAGRPDKYDFSALEQRLRAKLGDLDAE